MIDLGLGLLAALAAAQSLASMLYGVTAADPPTLVAACPVLALATLTACYCRRAVRHASILGGRLKLDEAIPRLRSQSSSLNR